MQLSRDPCWVHGHVAVSPFRLSLSARLARVVALLAPPRAKRRRWLAKSLVLVAIATVAVAVLAPSPDAIAQGDGSNQLESIRKYLTDGQAKYAAKDYAGAAKIFEAGYAKHPYSAFLFNAGVCFQKLDQKDKAIAKFEEYLAKDPKTPDADAVRGRIAKLKPPPVVDAGAPDGDAATDGGTTAPPPVDAGPPPGPDDDNMRSLVLIETDPAGAPIQIFQRSKKATGKYKVGATNPGWKEIRTARAPASIALPVGRYHIVIPKYRDYNSSDTPLDVAAGQALKFVANLSQGKFMAALFVKSKPAGAYVYLDDEKKAQPYWTTTPGGHQVTRGEHTVLVEKPGFQPALRKIFVEHGDQTELVVDLKRQTYGFLRVTANAPEVRVRVDEKPVGIWRSGEKPLEVRLPSGQHKLTVEGDGRKTYNGVVDVPKGQVLPIEANLIPTYPRGAAWTQAVISAVVIGASVYFGLESNSLFDQVSADRDAGVLQEDDERISRGRLFAIGADVGFIVGGVLAGLAVYNFVKDPLPESDSKIAKPEEFDDPNKKLPSGKYGVRYRAAKRRRLRPTLSLGPSFGQNSGGLVFGGSF